MKSEETRNRGIEYGLRHRRKIRVLTHYGSGKLACVKCGFGDIKALSIDHINGGGEQDRYRLDRRGGHPFYKWLIDNGYPEGLQTLCMNCQFIKRADLREYASTVRQLAEQSGVVRRCSQQVFNFS
jgi:hypothetical protein